MVDKNTQQEALLGQTVKNTLEEQFKSQHSEQDVRALSLSKQPSLNQSLGGQSALAVKGSANSTTQYAVGQIRLEALQNLRAYANPLS